MRPGRGRPGGRHDATSRRVGASGRRGRPGRRLTRRRRPAIAPRARDSEPAPPAPSSGGRRRARRTAPVCGPGRGLRRAGRRSWCVAGSGSAAAGRVQRGPRWSAGVARTVRDDPRPGRSAGSPGRPSGRPERRRRGQSASYGSVAGQRRLLPRPGYALCPYTAGLLAGAWSSPACAAVSAGCASAARRNDHRTPPSPRRPLSVIQPRWSASRSPAWLPSPVTCHGRGRTLAPRAGTSGPGRRGPR